jgi:rhomboid protease GluP
MSLTETLVWLVAFSCAALIVRSWFDRETRQSWLWLSVAILGATLGGHLASWPVLRAAGEIVWAIFVLGPSLLSMAFVRFHLAQRFGVARRIATVMRVLHPSADWRQWPEMTRALELAQNGREEAAMEILRRYAAMPTTNGLVATAQLYRIGHRWKEFVEWRKRHLPEDALARHPSLWPLVLRALGETGDLNGLIAWYEQAAMRIDKLPAPTRGFCRLALFAFCGRVEALERVLAHNLRELPEEFRRLWGATAKLAAGRSDEAKLELEALSRSPDHTVRAAAAWRLDHPLTDPREALAAGSDAVLEQAERTQWEEERYVDMPRFWGGHARATRLLVAANVVVFGIELALGGSTNIETLSRMGAVTRLAVQSGEWWRLGASLFLHFGPVHLAMNLLALAWLGPLVEKALGGGRFLSVYLLAGICASAVTWLKMAAQTSDEALVGASGSIMGLVGATAAIVVRGWLRQKAPSAYRRLLQLLLIVGTQTVFDLFTPRVSLTAHLSGLAAGFLVSSLLPHHANGSERGR